MNTKTVEYLAKIPNTEVDSVLPAVRAAVTKFAPTRRLNVVRDSKVGATYVYTRDSLGPYPVNPNQATSIRKSLQMRIGLDRTNKVFNKQLLPIAA